LTESAKLEKTEHEGGEAQGNSEKNYYAEKGSD